MMQAHVDKSIKYPSQKAIPESKNKKKISRKLKFLEGSFFDGSHNFTHQYKNEIIVVSIIVAFAIMIMTLLFFSIENNRTKSDDVKANLIIAAFNGMLIAIGALAVKRIWEDSEARRKNMSLRIERKENLFNGLKKSCAKEIENLFRTKTMRSKNEILDISILVGDNGGTQVKYSDLLDDWQGFEPDGLANEARIAFHELNDYWNKEIELMEEKVKELKEKQSPSEEIIKVGSLSEEVREKFRSEIGDWQTYYRHRVWGNDPVIPQSWQNQSNISPS